MRVEWTEDRENVTFKNIPSSPEVSMTDGSGGGEGGKEWEGGEGGRREAGIFISSYHIIIMRML